MGFLVTFMAVIGLVICLPFLLDHRTFLASNLHDALFIADIGYRFSTGQVPHVAFYSPLGVGFAAIMALGTLTADTVLGALRNASLLFGLGLIPVLLYVCRTRLAPVGSAVLIAVCLVVAVVPHNLGDPPTAPGYHSNYNRMAYVLFLLVIVITMARPARSIHAVIDRYLLSALTVLLLYLKLNYGVFALAFVFAAAALDCDARLAISAFGMLAVAALALELLLGAGFHAAYLSDLVILVKAASPFTLRRAVRVALGSQKEAALLLIALWAAGAPGRWPDWRILLLGGLALTLGFLLLVQNTVQAWGLVIGLGPALALLGRPAAQGARTWSARAGPVVLVLLGLLYVGPPVVSEAVEIMRVRAVGAAIPPGIPALADLVVVPTLGFLLPEAGPPLEPEALRLLQVRFSNGQPPIDAYVTTLRSGLDLLSGCPADAGIVTLDFTDAFAMLRRSPARGGAAWLHYGLDFTALSHPAPERLFGGVACVMVPELPVYMPTFEGIMATYGPFLAAQYAPHARNRFWTLYLRIEQ